MVVVVVVMMRSVLVVAVVAMVVVLVVYAYMTCEHLYGKSARAYTSIRPITTYPIPPPSVSPYSFAKFK